MISGGPEVNDKKMGNDIDETLSGSRSEDQSEIGTENTYGSIGTALVMVGCPIPHPSNIEIPLGRQTFLSKHNLNMKFTYVDERLAEFFGWGNDELIGKSIFELHHALDNDALDKSFKCLFSKGQCETVAYRFLGRTGGYAWVVTQATVIHCTKRRKPLSIVCVNYILSGIEYGDEVYSICQLEARNSCNDLKKNKKVDEGKIDTKIIQNNNDLSKSIQKVTSSPICQIPKSDSPMPIISPHRDIGASVITNKKKDSNTEFIFQNKPVIDYNSTRSCNDPSQSVTKKIFGDSSIGTTSDQDTLLSITNRSSPQTATASIFAPRTEDMNKGFLTFSDDQPGLTMLKDEPEDLTHLAPTPGDVCVPLEDTPFLSDMLDEFMLSNENYCTLLSPMIPTELPDSNSGLMEDTIQKNDNFGETLDSDPFFYTNPCSNLDSSQSTTINLTNTPTKSPKLFSIDLLHNSDTSNIATDSGISEDELLMLNIDEVIADDELALRAPYIPMSDQDEALQMLISDNMVMWGPTQPPDRSDWDSKRDSSDYYKESSLAKLLKNNKNSNKYDSISTVNLIEERDQNLKIGVNKRSNKRLHETSSLNTVEVNKRMKCQMMDKNTLIAAKKSSETDLFHTVEYTISVDGMNQKNIRINYNNFADTKANKMRLLQQLIEDRELSTTAKSSNLNNVVNRKEHLDTINLVGDADGDDENLQDHQSNSVLMNLLISGCDKMYVDLPTLLEEKLRIPLSINITEDH
ncbi:protein similar-like isoform X3 [Cotesia glomerata]|nr:protein similar-like isoform X3 [Cotesia glomerata]